MSSSLVLASRFRAVWPLARSSTRARSAHSVAPSALEAVESRSQVLTRLDSTSDAAEELAVGELAAGTLERPGRLGVRVERRREEALGFALVLAEECAAVQDHRTRPGDPAALRPRLEDVEPGACAVPFVRADRSFDPVERAPEDDQRGGDLSTAPQRLLCPTESQLEQRQRPLCDLGDDAEPARRGELPTLGRQRPALVLRPSRGREQREHDELLCDQIVLADLPRELEPLSRVGGGGGPAPRPDLRECEARKDLRHDAERAARVAPGRPPRGVSGMSLDHRRGRGPPARRTAAPRAARWPNRHRVPPPARSPRGASERQRRSRLRRGCRAR